MAPASIRQVKVALCIPRAVSNYPDVTVGISWDVELLTGTAIITIVLIEGWAVSSLTAFVVSFLSLAHTAELAAILSFEKRS
jgi:hypothetical protein